MALFPVWRLLIDLGVKVVMLIVCPADFTVASYEVVIAAGPRGLVVPPYKGSTLRGGFASTFRRLACAAHFDTCKDCSLKDACPYHVVFETSPPPGSQALRNLSDIPRPFILEPPLEDKTDYAPGANLAFNLILTGQAIPLFPYFVVTLEELGHLGMGTGRRPFKLAEIAAFSLLDGYREIVYRGADRTIRGGEHPMTTAAEIWAAASRGAGEKWSGRVQLSFLTPTRITHQANFARVPEFHVVIRNLLRRISSLAYFHNGHVWEVDFAGIIQEATRVALVENRTCWQDWQRYSSRQDKKIPLGGLVGEAVYDGVPGEFWPLLRLGEVLHVGKGVVFGLGKYIARWEGGG